MGISFKVLGGELEIPERISEFSSLEITIDGGTFLLLGLRTLLLPEAPEAKSSDELNKLNDTFGRLDFALTTRLCRVTKRPNDGGQSLKKKEKTK